MGLGWQEIVLILIVVLLLFGPRRLPEFARSIVDSVREMKKAMSGTPEVEVKQPEVTTLDEGEKKS